MKEKISTKIVRTIQSSIITIDALRRKIHILFFYLKKKKKRENKIPSIPSLLPPTLVESKIFTFYKSSGDNRMKRNEEERGKLKRREREKRAILENRRVSQSRRAFFFTPLRERCILNVAWRKLFQKDRKCAREWTTAPKLNITSQSFVECAAIYSVSLVDPSIYSN